MKVYKMVAPCMFGVEGILADELKRLGALNVKSENGRVFFEGDCNILAAANINLRTAERVILIVGMFKATTFEELFENTTHLPWEDFIGSKDAFPVTGYSISSQLHSVPDCQAIIKKAIVKRLSGKYSISWFEEIGPVHKIRFSIQKNNILVGIDTSGEGLHKRGYRANSLLAPIKETLAAAMCYTARIYPDTMLYDPFCGSGTILIESALMAKNIAPGIRRYFSAEKFSEEFKTAFAAKRKEAIDKIQQNVEFRAFGSDIDKAAVDLTLQNAKKAGVSDVISAKACDVKNFVLPEDRMLLITNPPYGERLLDIENAQKLYSVMGEKFERLQGKKYFIISPNDDFESFFGRPADKRRKLYNGMIKCQLYMYFKNEFRK
ncbi:MAG: class I SAM-dependent RNA methyltransferase [Clostridia bacterium]|nr:class I SAM-dependent RNA methyltransferase [Clostridia bacterium]